MLDMMDTSSRTPRRTRHSRAGRPTMTGARPNLFRHETCQVLCVASRERCVGGSLLSALLNQGASMDTTKPTVVFVHGAWADNSGWDSSIRALRGRGFRAIGAANPLRDLRSDAAYVAALLRSIDGPIVMVGHSYGGAIISNAATGNDQVRALGYINGWVPDEGESLIQLAQLNEGSLSPDSLQPVAHTNDGSDGVDLYLDQEKFPAAFAADVDPQ